MINTYNNGGAGINDIIYLWPTCQFDGKNGVRVNKRGDVVDILLCDRENSDSLISVYGIDKGQPRVVNFGSNEHDMAIVDKLLQKIDPKEKPVGETLCPFFDLDQLYVIQWDFSDGIRRYNCIRRDGLHSPSKFGPISFEELDDLGKLWEAGDISVGFFIGDSNPDICETCFKVTQEGGTYYLTRQQIEGNDVVKVDVEQSYPSMKELTDELRDLLYPLKEAGTGAFLFFNGFEGKEIKVSTEEIDAKKMSLI